MIKKKLIVFVACALLFGTLALPGNAMTLSVNGTSLDCYVENGITYTPVRYFVELFSKYSIDWNGKDRIAEVTGAGLNMDVFADKSYTVANERVLVRDGINKNINGRVYAPVTVLAKAIGADVHWDPGTDHVTVTGGGNAIAPGSAYYNSDDLYWLSRIISAESAGEPFIGKCAVGNVVLNRVRSSQFPSSVEAVIFDTQYGVQFSPISNGTIYNYPTEESILAAKAVLDGFMKSDKVLYFFNPRTAQSSWISQNRPFCFTIGNHAFYS